MLCLLLRERRPVLVVNHPVTRELVCHLARGTTNPVQIASTGLLLGALLSEWKPLWLVNWPGTMDMWLGLGREMTSPVQVVSTVLPLGALGFERQAVAVPGIRRGGT